MGSVRLSPEEDARRRAAYEQHPDDGRAGASLTCIDAGNLVVTFEEG